MTTERAMRLAENWSNGLVCSLREGEAAEYHKMFLDMLRVKQEAEQQGPCSRCGYGGQHLDAPPCTTCEVENSTPLTLNELRESVSLLRTKMSLPNEVLTNADRIRATSSDEEMVTALMPIVGELSAEYIQFWLQQPAEKG